MKNQITLKLWASLRLFVMIALVFNLVSCSDDDEETTPTIPKNNSVTILHEGVYDSQNGTISTFSTEDKTLQTKLYDHANGAGIGGSINSGFIHEGRLYAMTQSLDQVVIVNATNFQKVNAITDQMRIPRNGVIVGNKLYVSNWGEYEKNTWRNPDSYVLAIDLSTNSVIKKIHVPNRAETLLVVDNEIFVSQEHDSIISVINTNSDDITETIPVSTFPSGMVLDKDKMIWLVTKSGTLQKINPKSKEVEQTIDITVDDQSPNGLIRINSAGDKLYFVVGQSWASTIVNEVDLTSNELTPKTIITKDNIYGLGIDPVDGTIYAGITPDYKSNGVVVRFSSDGTELDNFTGGISPKVFLFD